MIADGFVARTVGVVGAAVVLGGCDVPFAPGLDDYRAELAERKGELVAAEVVREDSSAQVVSWRFELVSSSGLRVRGRFRADPAAGAGDRRPLVLLLGGIERGGDAVDLLPTDLGPVAAALWYPDALDADDAEDALRRLDELASLAWDIPASVLLALDWLLARPEVDETRVAAVGASFGGFFLPAAAAADTRIDDVGLLYAGGDLPALLAYHLDDHLPRGAAILGAEMATLRLQRLEPIRYVGSIAPRHVLLVNGEGDDLVGRRAAEALIDATRAPKDVVWLPTGHLDPEDEPMLRELIDTALVRLPVLEAR